MALEGFLSTFAPLVTNLMVSLELRKNVLKNLAIGVCIKGVLLIPFVWIMGITSILLSKVGLYGVDGSKLVCLFKMCLNGLLSVIVYVVVTLYLKVPQSIFHFQVRKKSGV